MRGKKVIALLSMTGMIGGLLAGCGSALDAGDASAPKAAVIQGTDVSGSQDMPQESFQGTSISRDEAQNTSRDGENASGGRWQALDSKTAEVVDADFLGVVWKLDTESFYIVEDHVEILEDGSSLGGSPSTDAEIPDSELIQVVYDENTRFYIRTIKEGGKSYEDTEAGFQDIEEYVSVDLKGQFKNDVFYAEEVRINKVQ